MKHLERQTPEAMGVSSKSIMNMLEALVSEDFDKELHSLMILRNGKVIAEGYNKPYDAKTPHGLYSLSKSFTSVAIGFAVEEGLLSETDRVVTFFDDYDVPESYYQMEVKHLLTMSTGQDSDIFVGPSIEGKTDWVAFFFEQKMSRQPGEVFAYNTGATYMLSVILQRVANERLDIYLSKRLFKPLGFAKTHWQVCPKGYATGGFGLHLVTEDIAKFGQCCLEGGSFMGKQIIPKAWIDKATSKLIENRQSNDNEVHDWNQGYGYQFWRCTHGAYRADGAFGQYCVVMEEQDMVVCMTGARAEMGDALVTVWKYLLPGLSMEGSDADYKKLLGILENLSLDKNESKDIPSEMIKTYALESPYLERRALTIKSAEEGCVLTFHKGGRQIVIPAGYQSWEAGKGLLDGFLLKTHSKAFWRTPNELVITCRYIYTPHADRFIINFTDQGIHLHVRRNVSFEPYIFEVVGRVDE